MGVNPALPVPPLWSAVYLLVFTGADEVLRQVAQQSACEITSAFDIVRDAWAIALPSWDDIAGEVGEELASLSNQARGKTTRR